MIIVVGWSVSHSASDDAAPGPSSLHFFVPFFRKNIKNELLNGIIQEQKRNTDNSLLSTVPLTHHPYHTHAYTQRQLTIVGQTPSLSLGTEGDIVRGSALLACPPALACRDSGSRRRANTIVRERVNGDLGHIDQFKPCLDLRVLRVWNAVQGGPGTCGDGGISGATSRLRSSGGTLFETVDVMASVVAVVFVSEDDQEGGGEGHKGGEDLDHC